MEKRSAVRFANAGEATKELVEAYTACSSALTKHSIEVAFAVIAANWAVYGGTREIITNLWARWSVVIALLFLGYNLVATRLMAQRNWDQIELAESDHEAWEKGFEQTAGTNDPWPYTKKIESLGHTMRAVKAFAPVVGAALFLLSLFLG